MTVAHTDIRHDSLVLRLLPARARPFGRLMRLDRPAGWWLVLLPCWWSTALAEPFGRGLGLYLLFWIGAVAMRGAGCTLNDILDRKMDAQVERTRGRPIPSGEVSVGEAVLLLVALLAVGAAVLFSLNRLSIALGFAVLLLVATYPLMKRVTFWPQFFLGLNFNWGALIGWSAVTGRIAAASLVLYAAGIFWTLGYDTIYAYQDRRDDPGAGVKSTALRLGDDGRRYVGLFFAASVMLLAGTFVLAGAGLWAWPMLALVALHFAWQVLSWDPDDPADCLKWFKSNRDAGLLIWAACLAARV